MNEIAIKNWEVSLVRFIQVLIHVPVSLIFSYIVYMPFNLLDGALWNINEYINASFVSDWHAKQLANIFHKDGSSGTISTSFDPLIAWILFIVGSAIQINHEFLGDVRKAFVMKYWLAIKRWNLTLHDDFKP